jgi:hypothetical protein
MELALATASRFNASPDTEQVFRTGNCVDDTFNDATSANNDC